MNRPNILVIHTDQQRWDTLGVNGNPHMKTPNLDRLAAQGLNFNRCFSQSPVCMPSRISLLTGQYGSTLGLQHMAVPVPENALCLQHMLKRYGYTTGCIGKLHFLPHSNRDHRVPHPAYGFDHLEISDEPGCYEDAYRAWVRRKAPDQLDLISLGLPPVTAIWQRMVGFEDRIQHQKREVNRAQAFRGRSDVTHSAFVGEQVVEYLRRRHDAPFFLFAGFYSPHSPWVAPQEFLDLYDPETLPIPAFPPELDAKRSDESFSDDELRSVRHGYYAMVSEVDHYVGRILDCLEEQGIADETVVVFTSDHGEWLGEHLQYGKGYWAQDCISRVPLIIRWPGAVSRPGRTISEVVESIDVLPTILTAAGLPVPPHLQGGCLRSTPDGKASARTAIAMLPRRTARSRSSTWTWTLMSIMTWPATRRIATH